MSCITSISPVFSVPHPIVSFRFSGSPIVFWLCIIQGVKSVVIMVITSAALSIGVMFFSLMAVRIRMVMYIGSMNSPGILISPDVAVVIAHIVR